jgi:peptide/nickel transport system ATP-binding protein
MSTLPTGALADAPLDAPHVEGARTSSFDPSADPVLSVRDLHVRFNTENGVMHAVRGVGFDLRPGEVLGIVGESGSGKSVTSLAIMGLLPETAKVEGSIRYGDTELVGRSDRQMCELRGKDIAMVFQDPLSSLTPVFTIGRQLDDAIRIHNPGWGRDRRRARAIELLTNVGIPAPESRLKAYPHHFSGGMRQRVMIAIAMANEPSVLICDEPTTALDVTIQAQILELLRRANELTGCAVIMITHDLGVIAGIADNVLVMYGGRPVEVADTRTLYSRPLMPYTVGLLASVPRIDQRAEGDLVAIEGHPPNLLTEPTGCPFAPRCPLARAECEQGEPELAEVRPGHRAACVLSTQIADGDVSTDAIFASPEASENALERTPREQRPVALELTDVVKHFPLTKGAVVKKRIGTVRAVDGVSFDVREGECLALVGESGSGKTTTLLEIMEMDRGQEGVIRIGEATNRRGDSTDRRQFARFAREVRKQVQMVFQDPLSSLDPRFTVFEVIAEPLENMDLPPAQVKQRVFELMRLVGLQADHVNRFPSQFSGGQRQRIAIARALAISPRLVVLDEPVSALDVSIQAGVLNMLDDLKHELSLSYLLVAHDLSVVRRVADRVAVMYLGRIVEYGDVEQIFDHPRHPYTQALLSAIPIPDPEIEQKRRRIILKGDLPSPLDVPTGCSFATRCPIFAHLDEEKRRKCLGVEPALEPVPPVEAGAAPAQDHEFACFFPEQVVPDPTGV